MKSSVKFESFCLKKKRGYISNLIKAKKAYLVRRQERNIESAAEEVLADAGEDVLTAERHLKSLKG